MSTIAEQQLPYDKALAELKKEIAMNGRLESLLKSVAYHEELALYRSTSKMVRHEELLHVTASAAAIVKFVNKITAFNESPNRADVSRR
jgi:hypothetical protein